MSALLVPSLTMAIDWPPASVWGIWFGVVAALALIGSISILRKKRRREALEQFGLEIGFSLSSQIERATKDELQPLQTSLGDFDFNPTYENLLRGTRDGRELVVTDRTEGLGRSRSTATVVGVRFIPPLPPFSLGSEGVLHRALNELGYKNIDLDSAPEFSRRFFLHSDEPHAVRELFTRDVIAAFEHLPREDGLHVLSNGQWMAVYRPGRVIPINELRGMIEIAVTLGSALHRAQQMVANKK